MEKMIFKQSPGTTALLFAFEISERVVGLERKVVVNYRHGIAVVESDCACPDVGNVADRPGSVTA